MIVKGDLERNEDTADSAVSAKGVRARQPCRDHEDLRRSAWRRKLLFGLLIVAVGGGAIAATSMVGRDLAKPDQPLVFHTVKRGNLPISVTERGNLESQVNVQIVCEVDDIPGDNINGTPIVWVIANGSSVKEGDLLVDLDSAPHQERLDEQILDTERAKAAQIQAEAKHENQKTQNDTNEANAKLAVRLADLELEMFQDEEKGTHKLEVAVIERQIDDVNNEIKSAEASLLLKKNELRGIESLFKMGYAGKSELDRSRLDFLQAEGKYTANVNKLSTQLASLTKKETYEKEMEELKLKGKQETARRELEQVGRNNDAFLAHTQSALDAANELLKKEEERLARYRDQVDKCKIYAPQDGMVAYAVSRSRYYSVEIREGAPIRPQQKILELPNLSKMQVKTSVHESVLDQIKPDLKATIRIEPFPDRVYQGTVQSVGVLPDQGGYFGSDTKVYETIVTLDEEVEQLKPGMTAVAEIHVDRLEDVLSVPVQAVVQIRRETWCYVDADGRVERRDVKLGRTNDKFVEILEGIDEGTRVVLNPMAIIDEAEQKKAEELAEEEDSLNSPSDNLPEMMEKPPAGENRKSKSPRKGKKPRSQTPPQPESEAQTSGE
ncbi:MAG: efflux RND transporter periplasmic adaptor subunit [Planctomycetes bacterium]|nr:efflux RND transporter periplasmic adaptor subunit [Planctomycetota bacterium]